MEYKIRKSLMEERYDDDDKLFYLGAAAFFALFFLVLIILNTYVYACVVVKGASMENTLFTDDVLVINVRDEIDYGDIVVINEDGNSAAYPSKIRNKIIKRVVGKGGDEVKFYGGNVYLKKRGEAEFTELNEGYIKKQGVSNYRSPASSVPETEETVIIVPDGEIFFLGDNRTNSSDARTYGTRSEDQVWGVVTGWSLGARPFMNFLSKLFGFGDNAH